jgi:prepilin-type N-terminal cleavage/methylation domain-containing protein
MAVVKPVAGFTLIELLISTVIMALVIGIATLSFSLFARNWDGRDWAFERSLGQLQRLDLAVGVLQGALPWAVRNNSGDIGFYFLGREEGVTFVSQAGVFDADAPALVRLFRESTGGGKWRLVYEEASLRSVSLRFADQSVPFQHRLVIVSGLNELRFRFFGRSLTSESAQAAGDDSDNPPIWWSEYDGMVHFQHPIKVEVNLDGSRVSYLMPDRDGVVANAIVREF